MNLWEAAQAVLFMLAVGGLTRDSIRLIHPTVE